MWYITQWIITQLLKTMKFSGKWIELEKILSEVNHTPKDDHGMYSLTSGYWPLNQ